LHFDVETGLHKEEAAYAHFSSKVGQRFFAISVVVMWTEQRLSADAETSECSFVSYVTLNHLFVPVVQPMETVCGSVAREVFLAIRTSWTA
jgi:hypothetical protein